MRKLIKTMVKAFDILKESQEELKMELKNYRFCDKIILKNFNENFVCSFKNNFFTILIISFLCESEIERKSAVSYSKIILLLRQVVTSCDNILDNERKGLFFIDNLKNLTVENSLITLISQELLTREIDKIEKEKKISSLSFKILDELYSIAEGESLRKVSLYQEYPSSEYILDKVHREIGGKLLEIGLVVPKIVEKNIKLDKFSQGLFTIGMSLQALDDFFDMEEDFENGNINLGITKYIEKFKIEPKEIEFKRLDTEFIEEYITEVISNSCSGFDILERAGFPIDRKISRFILKKLFILRGLKEYSHYIK